MYLMIQNPGVAPIEGFTVYGLSSARGSNNPSVIGQFGSGNKHATNLLLRQGINPIIYCGHNKLCFFTKPATMSDELGNVQYNRVYLSVGGKVQDLNFSVDYGSLDWTSVSMALREYVSNAIDRTLRGFGTINHKDFVVDIVPDYTSKDGTTRVFIPLTVDVQRFFNEINNWFLHFRGQQNTVLIENDDNDASKIYRNGVFVRNAKKGLFDYNFDKSLKIDESRNLSDYYVRDLAAAWLINYGTVEHFEHLIRNLVKGEDFFEAEFPEYTAVTKERAKVIKLAWDNVTCGRVLINDFPFIKEFCERKGYSTVYVKSERWRSILMRSVGVLSYNDLLDTDEVEGLITDEPTQYMTDALNYLWGKLAGFTKGKHKPAIVQFIKLVNAESTLLGSCRNNIIYVNSDIADGSSDMLYATILEELVHYITGSRDCSRDFQEFLLKVIVKEWRHGRPNTGGNTTTGTRDKVKESQKDDVF